MHTVLIVDDLREYRESMKLLLESENYHVLCAATIEEAVGILREGETDLILTDLFLGKENGIDLLAKVKAGHPDIDVIVLSAFATVETAVEAMKKGAFSYHIKSDDPSKLLLDMSRILELKKLRRENKALRRSNMFLESENPEFRGLLQIARRIAASSLSVLILGESGVGKEVIAQFIHEESGRSGGPFIPVHCQMYAKGLLESELFGHEKGSFTGAVSRLIGKFEQADQGTLFLDELGEMDESTQVKLLRVLEDKKVNRLGGQEAVTVDFRLISATNSEVSKGKLEGVREDLYYRLSGMVLKIPPLRERTEDIPGLIQYFLGRYSEEMKKPVDYIEEEALQLLCAYPYPGNVRELKNIVERLVVLSDHRQITREDVLLHVPFEVPPKEIGLREARGIFEKKHIASQLQRHQYDLGATADALGITRRQLNNKLAEYQLRTWLDSRLSRK